MVVSTGAAPSVGAVDAHDDRLAAASRMPPALVARVILNEPSAVVAARRAFIEVEGGGRPGDGDRRERRGRRWRW